MSVRGAEASSAFLTLRSAKDGPSMTRESAASRPASRGSLRSTVASFEASLAASVAASGDECSDAEHAKYEVTGEVEYHDLTTDPDEIRNTASSLPPERKKRLHEILRANVTCVGADACWAAQRLAP